MFNIMLLCKTLKITVFMILTKTLNECLQATSSCFFVNNYGNRKNDIKTFNRNSYKCYLLLKILHHMNHVLS